MLPDPIHPNVVHLPLALAALVPLFALGLAVAIALEALPLRTWSVVVALQLLLLGGAWLAIETGEEQEDRVERVVAETLIEGHEERAERLLPMAAIGLVVAGLGLLRGRSGLIARLGLIAVSLVLLAQAVRAGHSGGELVYRHGAARAFTGEAGASHSARGEEAVSTDDH